MSNEQTHPLHTTDKKIIDSLISNEKPEDIDFINLARLINRYSNFPGEVEIKDDIEDLDNFNKLSVEVILNLLLRVFQRSDEGALKRSSEDNFIAVAASRVFFGSLHKIEAHPSGDMTE